MTRPVEAARRLVVLTAIEIEYRAVRGHLAVELDRVGARNAADVPTDLVPHRHPGGTIFELGALTG